MSITKHQLLNSLQVFKYATSRLLDLVLPPRCPVTGELVGVQGTLHPSFWGTLNFIQSPFCKTCGSPFPHEVDGEMVCGACLKEPPEYDMARSVWRYDDASSAMILKFKHADALQLAPVLGGFLARSGAEILQGIDLIIPVPLHRLRLLKRRYNQAALLAKILHKQTGIPVAQNSLRRIRATESQGHKNHTERYSNLYKAFGILADEVQKISGKNILLVDDVYTSGATIAECTKTLLAAGASKVNVLCLAKVVRD